MRNKKEKTTNNFFDHASTDEVAAFCDEADLKNVTKDKRPSGSAKYKLKNLWADKRSFGVRAFLALLCSFACAFTFFVFGPYEIFIQNQQYIMFPFSTLVLPMALTGGAVFLALSIILLLLRGKIFNYALSALFAVTLAGYLQRNFLNMDYGSLDGSSIAWADFATTTLLNICVWFLIGIAVFLLLYFSRKIWARGIQLISIMLIGAQVIALCSMLFTTEFIVSEDDPYVSDKGIYNVTTGENVVFFLLDRFDNSYADELLEEYPEWKEKLSDFTYYHNFTGSYTRTMPSVAYLLTGIKCDYTIPFEDYFKKAWTESTFLSDIRDAGYITRVYSDVPYVFGDANNLLGKIDNVGIGGGAINYKQMLKQMLNLSAYSYAPEALKPSFWLYTGDLSTISAKAYVIDDPAFWQGMNAKGITVEESKGMFTFYHLLGAHNPYLMDEVGNRVPIRHDKVGRTAQIVGNMNMIFNYVEQLKALGQYENTTIIISADHGVTGSIRELDYERVPTLFIKPAGKESGEPLTISNKQVCQDNLRASIISYFGIDTTAYGRTIESIGEDEEMVREFWMQAGDAIQRDQEIVTYEIRGDANDFANWKEVAREEIIYPFYDTVKTAGL